MDSSFSMDKARIHCQTREARTRIKENSRLMPMPGSDYHGRPTKRDGRKIRQFMAEFDPSKDFSRV